MAETPDTGPRILPARAGDWTPEFADYIGGFRSSVASNPDDEGRASGSNLLGTLARHPDLAVAFLGFNRHLLRGTTLTARQRELLVLRVAHRHGSEYEWAQHVVLGRKAGLSEDDIAVVADDPAAPDLCRLEQAVLTAVDELLDGGVVGDPTWSVLSSEFDERRMMDLVFTVGAYSMLAMALRSFGVEPEDELLPHLPAAAGNGVVPR